MKLILRTTLPAFEALHAALAKVKQGTGKVSVPVDALRCLLTDHSTERRPAWRDRGTERESPVRSLGGLDSLYDRLVIPMYV
jgi:hypothetical protein